jgi:hypothetical protein
MKFNICHYELTDKSSATVRLALRFVWFLLGFLLVWLPIQPPRVPISFTYLVAGAGVYVSIVGFAFDHWKLRHPETPKLRFQRLSALAILPILVVFPVLLFLFR